MKFISAYLLAATVVESGSYEEEYYIEEDPEFAEFMEEGGDELIGEYVDIEVPTGGTAGSTSFSGDEFCEDWLSAFVRPIEYLEIYNTIASYSYTYPSTEDDSGWTGFVASNDTSKLIPVKVDELVESGSGKHVNMWFAEFLLQPWHNQSLGLKGIYIPSTVAFMCKGNYPVQGYGVFDYNNTQSSVFRPSIGGTQSGCYYASYENQWTGGKGVNNQSGDFILVYNVDAFKAFLSNLTRDQFRDLMDGRMLALAACHVEKDKVQGQTDWSDNDDYHGE